MDEKLQKLNKFAEILQKIEGIKKGSIVKPEDIKKFLELVLGIVKRSKEELAQLSDENIKVIKDSIAFIEQNYTKWDNTIDSKINTATRQMEAKMTLIKSLVAEVKVPEKGVDYFDGINPDPEDVVPLVLAKLPKVEPFVLERLKVVKEINTGKKDDLKIDLKQIESLDKIHNKLSDNIINRAIGIVDQRTSFLINKVNNLKAEVDTMEASDIDSVSNLDGTLTISPTTGNVVASLNLGNANTWTGIQTINQIKYGNGSVMTDVNGKLYYGLSGTVLANESGQLQYSTGSQLANELGELNYGDGGTLTDASGNLYFANFAGNGVHLDNLGNGYFTSGNPFFDTSENVYGTWAGNIISPTVGGTGQNGVTTGDLLYGSATDTWNRLADIATGNALISGGVNTAPSWGKIGLTTHISGTLAAGNGGTGVTSFGGVNTILYTTAANTLAATTNFVYNAGLLQVVGGAPNWTTSGFNKALELPNIGCFKWAANASGYRWGFGQTTGGIYWMQNSADSSATALYRSIWDDNGSFNYYGLAGIPTASNLSVYQTLFTIAGVGVGADSPFISLNHVTDDDAAKNLGMLTRVRANGKYLAMGQTGGQYDNSFGSAAQGWQIYYGIQFSNRTFTTVEAPTVLSGWMWRFYNGSAYIDQMIVNILSGNPAVMITKAEEQQRLRYDASNYFSTTVGSTGGVTFNAVGSGANFIFSDNVELDADLNHDGTNVGLYGVTPVARATTGVAEATFVENSGGTAVNVDSTFGGYTLQQVVQALQNIGILS